MRFITRLLSIGVGLAAGAAAVKLLRDQQEQGVFELGEDDYIELPHADPAAPAESTEHAEPADFEPRPPRE